MGKRFLVIFSVILLWPLTGCSPKVVVRKSNGIHDTGIKYYRPKPYLLITPDSSTVTVKESSSKSTSTTVKTDQFVSIELQYLPDFSEEYSINVRSGIGKADVSFKLDNGWNLTELNQNLDSQFDENLSAVADVVKAVGGVIPTGGAGFAEGGYQAEKITKKWVVQATNVPLGYYEAVISGECGQKRLYGWKYVGFAPFNACPTHLEGTTCADCEDELHGAVYGLVFVNGIMTFRQLNQVQAEDRADKRTEVSYGTTTYRTTSSEEMIKTTITSELRNEFVRSTKVSIQKIAKVPSPFPDTIQFEVETVPPLTKTLKDRIKKKIGELPGLPPKVQIDFN